MVGVDTMLDIRDALAATGVSEIMHNGQIHQLVGGAINYRAIIRSLKRVFHLGFQSKCCMKIRFLKFPRYLSS